MTPFIGLITVEQYGAFIDQNPNLALFTPDISNLKHQTEINAATAIAASQFENLIRLIKENIADHTKGVAAVDIPQHSALSPLEDAYWGVSLALSITRNIFQPIDDRINDTPYTVYAASHRNSDKLACLGLPRVAPETKLGFHTDGLLMGQRIALPHRIMLYNISIEYDKPGNFYWIPFSLWHEKQKYIDKIGIGNKYQISVTPSVYETKTGGIETVSPHYVRAPIFVDASAFDYPMYLNGTVIGRADSTDFDVDIVQQMKKSLSLNPKRFAIPQKARRLIFAKNTTGAHARDIFESPNTKAEYTRVFIRSVDKDYIELG